MLAAAMTLAACGDETIENDALPSGTIALTQTSAEMTEEASSETVTETETQTVTETVTESETTVTETETVTETTTAETTSVLETTTVTTTMPAPETVTEATLPDYSSEPVTSFIINGVCYSADDKIDVNALGTQTAPASEFPSCMGDGSDCIYTYSGFSLTTYKDGSGNESFSSLIVTDITVTNPKGLNCGISESDALAVLGDYYVEINGTAVSFIAENGIVTEVDYMKLI